MGKNVYAAPRKGPAGKWVEPAEGKQPFLQDQEQARQARLQALAERYRKQSGQKARGGAQAENTENGENK